MKLKLILTTAIVGAAFALPGVSSAWAQAPPNDTFEQATVISSLPFSQTLDTSEATTDSTDAEALASCGISDPPQPRRSGTSTRPPSIRASSSRRPDPATPAGVAVLTGSPGSLFAVTCSLGLGTFSATAGQTYHILVADISGGNGGTLNLSVETTPGFELSVDRFGRFDPKTGAATVTGTLTCPSGSTGTVFSGSLSQRTTTADTVRRTPSTSPATARPSRGRSHSLRLTASSGAGRPTCRRTPSSALPSAASSITPTEVSLRGSRPRASIPAVLAGQHGHLRGARGRAGSGSCRSPLRASCAPVVPLSHDPRRPGDREIA